MPAPTDRDTIRFVTDTLDAFDAAYTSETHTDVTHATLADRHLRIRYVSPELAERFGANLNHLAVDRAETRSDHELDLDIRCWDRSATEVHAPPSPWSIDDHLPTGYIRGLIVGPIRATFDPAARVLCLYDSERRAAVVHAARADLVPLWMDRAPFRTVLTWWAADRGLALLHASAVATASGAVVLAGTSGAGKSTTALRCLLAGLELLGDDACLVGCTPEPTVHSVYRFAKVDEPLVEPLPPPLSRALPWITDEFVIDPGSRHRSRAPLRAILLPRITGGAGSRLVPVSRAEALRILGPTTVVEGGAPSREALRAIVDLVGCVPAFRLELGTDPAGIVDAVVAATEGQS
ncbi:MAG: hypothetical protein ACKOIA_09555 [Acidimicrobiia bacterium]